MIYGVLVMPRYKFAGKCVDIKYDEDFQINIQVHDTVKKGICNSKLLCFRKEGFYM